MEANVTLNIYSTFCFHYKPEAEHEEGWGGGRGYKCNHPIKIYHVFCHHMILLDNVPYDDSAADAALRADQLKVAIP